MVDSLISLSKRRQYALDTIQLSHHKATLNTEKDKVVMSCSFDKLQLVHLVDVLKAIHSTQPSYDISAFNC